MQGLALHSCLWTCSHIVLWGWVAELGLCWQANLPSSPPCVTPLFHCLFHPAEDPVRWLRLDPAGEQLIDIKLLQVHRLDLSSRISPCWFSHVAPSFLVVWLLAILLCCPLLRACVSCAASVHHPTRVSPAQPSFFLSYSCSQPERQLVAQLQHSRDVVAQAEAIQVRFASCFMSVNIQQRMGKLVSEHSNASHNSLPTYLHSQIAAAGRAGGELGPRSTPRWPRSTEADSGRPSGVL